MSVNVMIKREVTSLEEEIRNNSALYFIRATPFSEYGKYKYDGLLTEDFFFENLFSKQGESDTYCEQIIEKIKSKQKNSIVLIGNQGCGKTTFLNYLKKHLENESVFEILDFDKDTSNPTLEDYIERFSTYFHEKIRQDYRKNNSKINKLFNNLYIANKGLILGKINGANKVKKFFQEFYRVFIECDFTTNNVSEFINDINQLFFNQLLSLVVLWHIAEFTYSKRIIPIVFCLDNLDVLVNSEIITGFFEEYYIFLRNIDSIIQNLESRYIENSFISYDRIFTFIFSCRQHTWAKVKKTHLHQGNMISISTFEKNITEAFDKNAILTKREDYIVENKDIYNDFVNDISAIKSLLQDMHGWNNIYDLFNDDYRQCSVTFERLLEENPNLLTEYIALKKKMKFKPLYGARGLIYKSLFDMFRDNNLFNLIGVLDINSIEPPVSDVRIILNYLDNFTYGKDRSVTYATLVNAFKGIVSAERINSSLIEMFNLGVGDSLWNELVAFVQIDTDELDNCEGTSVFITKAGHEYLNLISTHFEFFNVRVTEPRMVDAALYSDINLEKYSGYKEYEYNFQETIQNVINIVKNCCEKMSKFYEDVMFVKFGGKENYLKSEFVYSNNNTKVFHGERIIHTHIRYIDQYRLHILRDKEKNDENSRINEILVNFIKSYISIGLDNPNVLSSKSYELFDKFSEKIEKIENSKFDDYVTPINL